MRFDGTTTALDVEDGVAALDPERNRKTEERAARLIAQEMTLHELRKARKLTLVSVAHELGIAREAVSRLEQRSDLLLSTPRKAFNAMGGSLSPGSPTARRSNLPASPSVPPANDLHGGSIQWGPAEYRSAATGSTPVTRCRWIIAPPHTMSSEVRWRAPDGHPCISHGPDGA